MKLPSLIVIGLCIFLTLLCILNLSLVIELTVHYPVSNPRAEVTQGYWENWRNHCNIIGEH